MKIPNSMPRLKGFRFPREVIAYAVWAYFRFPTSTGDVEDLLAARGIVVSRETVRQWVNRFGWHFADCIRRDRPRPNNKALYAPTAPKTARLGPIITETPVRTYICCFPQAYQSQIRKHLAQLLRFEERFLVFRSH